MKSGAKGGEKWGKVVESGEKWSKIVMCWYLRHIEKRGWLSRVWEKLDDPKITTCNPLQSSIRAL